MAQGGADYEINLQSLSNASLVRPVRERLIPLFVAGDYKATSRSERDEGGVMVMLADDEPYCEAEDSELMERKTTLFSCRSEHGHKPGPEKLGAVPI